MHRKLNSIFMDIVVEFNLEKCNEGFRWGRGEQRDITQRESKNIYAITRNEMIQVLNNFRCLKSF